MHAFVEQMLGFEPEDGEDDCACVDRREGVAPSDEENVPDAVGAWSVVAAEGNDGSEGKAIWVEDLLVSNR